MTGDCTGDGTTSQSCDVSGLGQGAQIVYIACIDGATNANTAGNNEHVNYNVDSIAPTITARETVDLNHDGILDAIHIVFSENIKDTTLAGGGFAVDTATDEAIDAGYNGDTPDDDDIYIAFTTGGMNTGATPNVTYTQTPGTITDLAGNPLASSGPIAATDKAQPIVLSAALGEGNGVVTVTLSENCNSSVTRAMIKPAGTASKFGTTNPTVVNASNSNTITFTLAFSNTDADMFVAGDVFNFAGSEASITDTNANTLYTNAGQPTINLAGDTVEPDFTTASKTANKILTVNFSEPIDMSTVQIADFLIIDNSVTKTVNGVTPVDADTVNVSVTTNFSNNKIITVEMSGAGAIQDLAGRTLNDTNDTQITAGDSLPPNITARETADCDSDGYIDAIHIIFDEFILDTTVNSANFTISGVGALNAFSSSPLPCVDTANDEDIYLTFTDGVKNTAFAPAVRYVTSGLTDLSGNPLATEGAATTSTDKAPPVIIAASTGEAAGTENGFVDTIKLTYSEPVNVTTGARNEFSVAALPSNTLTAPNCVAGCGSGTANITLSVTNAQNAGAYDTDETPANIIYTVGAANIVEDIMGNDAPSQTFSTITDGAGPVIISAVTADTDPNGYLDTILFTFSENISYPTPEIDDWGLTDADTTDLKTPLTNGNVTVSGANTITITLADNIGSTGAPTYTYTQSGSNDVEDSLGNKTPNKAATTATDGAAPVLMSVSSNKQISGGNLQSGTILTMTYSENVSKNAALVDSDFVVTNGTWAGGVSTVYASGGGNLITATVSSETTTKTWTGTPTFNRSGSPLTNANAIEDSTGNDAVANVTAPSITGITDTTPPTITAISTMDDNNDGKLDAIKVTFSENIDDSTFDNTSQWSMTNGLVFTGSKFTPSGGDTPDDNIIYLGLTDTGYNTGVVPDVTTTTSVNLEDFNANNKLAQTLSGTVFETDGAKPVIVQVTEFDITQNGKVDQIAVEFSESIVDTSVAGQSGRFTHNVIPCVSVDKTTDPGGTAFESNSVDPNVGNDKYITLFTDDSTTAGTDAKAVEFSALATKFLDSAGNQMISDATITAVDKAAPVITAVDSDKQISGGNLQAGTKFTITFSEDVIVTGAGINQTDFSVTNGTWHDGASVSYYGGGSSNTMIAELTTGTTSNNWVVPVTFNRSASALVTGNSIEDASGNDAVRNLAVSPAISGIQDTGAPEITAIKTLDDNNNGKIDTLKITLSEYVDDSTFSATGWTIDGGSMTVTSPTLIEPNAPEVDTDNDNIIYVRISETGFNTGYIPSVSTDATVTLTDLGAGNPLMPCSACVTPTDGAAPVIISTATTDTEPDGDLDTVVFTYSEDIIGNGETVDWTLADADTTDLMTGASVSKLGATLTISLAGNLGTTGAPTYTYSKNGVDNIRDAAGNQALAVGPTPVTDTSGPVLKSVSSSNQLSGGNVPAGTVFTLTFSENVVINTPTDVKTGDFVVTNGSWPDGATVSFADGAGYTMTATFNTGTTSKDWLGTATFNRKSAALTVPGAIKDASNNDALANNSINPTIADLADLVKPSITAISTLDDDHNGKLDAIKVTLSENVDDSTFTGTGWAITGGLSFTGTLLSPVNSEVDIADDNIIYVKLNETTYNTGIVPDVTTDGTEGLTDIGGGNTLSVTGSGIIETDGAKPVAYAAKIMDKNYDGSVDVIRVTLSENIVDTSFDVVNWSIADTSSKIGLLTSQVIADETDVANDNIIYINVVASTPGDTDLVGQTYDVRISGSALKDSANNTVADCAAADCIVESDGAPPAIISTITADSEPNGFIDTVTLTYSEIIVGSGETADWTLTDANGTVNLMTGLLDTDIVPSGNKITITLKDNSGTTGPPAYAYSKAGSDNIRDAAGNQMPAKTPTPVTDGAKPVVTAVKILDDNHDGTMDVARITLSESLPNANFNTTGWVISDTTFAYGVLTGASVLSETDIANDNVFYLSFTAGNTLDTDLVGEVYDTTVAAGTTADAAGNSIATCDSACVLETDGASPVVKTISTMDDNFDGTIDTMKIVLTEAVDDSTFTTSGWAVTYTSAISGLRSVKSVVDTVDDATIYLGITPTKTDDTDLITENYDTTVTNGQLTDLAGNKIINLASGTIIETDGAPPAIIGTEASGGRNDVNVYFSEAVYNAPGAPAGGNLTNEDIEYTDFNPPGSPRTKVSFSAAAGSTSGVLMLSTPITLNDDIPFDSVNAALNSIYDSVNNVASINASATLRDTSVPTIVNVYEFDTDEDGNIDQLAVQFSEFIADASVTPADAARFTMDGINCVSVDKTTNPSGQAYESNSIDPNIANDQYITQT